MSDTPVAPASGQALPASQAAAQRLDYSNPVQAARERAASLESGAKPFTASASTIHLWALGAIADYWMYAQFAAITLIFTTYYGTDPFLIGIALFMPRILDGILDPIIGHWSDITHTRWGRRRPFILGTAILGSVLSMAIWWASPEWASWVKAVWVGVTALLLFAMWGTFTMAHSALGYELSDDYNDRSRVFAIKSVYFSLMSIGGGYFLFLAICLHDGISLRSGNSAFTIKSVGSEITGIRMLSVAVAALILVSGILTAMFTRERFARSNRAHVSLLKACYSAMQVKPFRTLLLLQITRTLGTSFYATLHAYIGIYYVCQGDKKLYAAAQMGLGGIFGFLFAVVMWPVARPLTKYIGKRMGLILTFGLSFGYALLLPFITKPGHIYLLVFSGFALIFPMAVQNLFLTSVMPDLCDIDELQSGERREGLFSAVKSFVDKIEISLCNLLALGVLSYIGFQAKALQQSPEVIRHMLWWGFTPKIIFSGVALVLAWYFPITEAMMIRVREQLVERRRAAASNVKIDPAAEAYDAAPATTVVVVKP